MKIKNALPLFILGVTLLSGCGPNQNREYINFYIWGDSVELSRYEKIARDYKTKTNIDVNIIPATGNYYDNLNIYLGSKNNAPDIFFTEQGEILNQLAADRLLDLSPYIESGQLDVVSPENADGKIKLWQINDAYRYDGQSLGTGSYYAFIKDWSPDFIMWYNKSHIDTYNTQNGFTESDEGFMSYPSETIPMTWDQFEDMSYKLTIKNNNITERYGTMFDRVPWKHLFQMIQQTGSTPFINGHQFNASDNGLKQAFDYFSRLQAGPKASVPIIGPSGIGSGDAFANGNLPIAWFGSWAYSAYGFDSLPFEFGIAPPPVPSLNRPLTAEDNYGVAAGMIALSVNKKSPVLDKTLDFLNYYMTDGAQYMAGFGFNIPGNELVAESSYYLNAESSEVRKINAYFLNFAKNYTHPLDHNRYISSIAIENQIGKTYSTWITNYNPNTLESMLNTIKTDINNEIG